MRWAGLRSLSDIGKRSQRASRHESVEREALRSPGADKKHAPRLDSIRFPTLNGFSGMITCHRPASTNTPSLMARLFSPRAWLVLVFLPLAHAASEPSSAILPGTK